MIQIDWKHGVAFLVLVTVCPTGIIRIYRCVGKQILSMRKDQKEQESNKEKHCYDF